MTRAWMLATFWYKGPLPTTDRVVDGGSAWECKKERIACRHLARVFLWASRFWGTQWFLGPRL